MYIFPILQTTILEKGPQIHMPTPQQKKKNLIKMIPLVHL